MKLYLKGLYLLSDYYKKDLQIEVKTPTEVLVTVIVTWVKRFFPTNRGVGYGNSSASSMAFLHLKNAQRA